MRTPGTKPSRGAPHFTNYRRVPAYEHATGLTISGSHERLVDWLLPAAGFAMCRECDQLGVQYVKTSWRVCPNCLGSVWLVTPAQRDWLRDKMRRRFRGALCVREYRAVTQQEFANVIERFCPGWETCELWPQAPQGWLDRLTDAFHVTGYWDKEVDEAVQFDIDDLEIEESTEAVDALDPASLSEWESSIFGDATEDPPGRVEELRTLKQRLPGLRISVRKITVGMKYCGTLEYGFVRVSRDGHSVDVRPVDVLWESAFDRTFGPMWESPDDRCESDRTAGSSTGPADDKVREKRTMKTMPTDAYETPVEEFPGYLGYEFEDMMSLDHCFPAGFAAVWVEYFRRLVDEDVSRTLPVVFVTGERSVTVDPTEGLGPVLDQVPTLEVWQDPGHPNAGPGGSGSGYVFCIADGATCPEVERDLAALLEALRLDLANLKGDQ